MFKDVIEYIGVSLEKKDILQHLANFGVPIF